MTILKWMIQKMMYDKRDILSTIITKSPSATNTEANATPKNQNDNITNTPQILYHFGARKVKE